MINSLLALASSQVLLFLMFFFVPATRYLAGFTGIFFLPIISFLFFLLSWVILRLYRHKGVVPPIPGVTSQRVVSEIMSGIWKTLLFFMIILMPIIVVSALVRALFLAPITGAQIQIWPNYETAENSLLLHITSDEPTSCAGSGSLRFDTSFSQETGRITVYGCKIHTSIDLGTPVEWIPIPTSWLSEGSEKKLQIILDGETNFFTLSLRNKEASIRPDVVKNIFLGRRQTVTFRTFPSERILSPSVIELSF